MSLHEINLLILLTFAALGSLGMVTALQARRWREAVEGLAVLLLFVAFTLGYALLFADELAPPKAPAPTTAPASGEYGGDAT